MLYIHAVNSLKVAFVKKKYTWCDTESSALAPKVQPFAPCPCALGVEVQMGERDSPGHSECSSASTCSTDFLFISG